MIYIYILIWLPQSYHSVIPVKNLSASHRSLASLASPEQPGVRGLRRHDVRRGGVGRNWLHRETGVWHWASLGAAGWGCWGWVNWNLEMLLLCWKNFQQLDWLGFIDTYSYLIHVYWFFFMFIGKRLAGLLGATTRRHDDDMARTEAFIWGCHPWAIGHIAMERYVIQWSINE
jgi:hypothetical protein